MCFRCASILASGPSTRGSVHPRHARTYTQVHAPIKFEERQQLVYLHLYVPRSEITQPAGRFESRRQRAPQDHCGTGTFSGSVPARKTCPFLHPRSKDGFDDEDFRLEVARFAFRGAFCNARAGSQFPLCRRCARRWRGCLLPLARWRGQHVQHLAWLRRRCRHRLKKIVHKRHRHVSNSPPPSPPPPPYVQFVRGNHTV